MLDIKNVGFTGLVGSGGDNIAKFSSPATPNYTNGDNKYYKFTSTASVTVSKGGWVKLLLQGGGGNSGTKYYGAGSGAGGLYYDFVEVTTGTYSMAVGGGGSNTTGFSKTALAGGKGKASGSSQTSGGCGGGNYHGVSDNLRLGLQPSSASGGYGTDGNIGRDHTNSDRVSGGGGGTDQDGLVQSAGSTVGSNGGRGKSNTQLDNILSITSSGVSGYLGGGGAATGGTHGAAGGTGGAGGGSNAGNSQNNSGFVAPVANSGGGGSGIGRYVSTHSGGSGLIIIVTGEEPVP